MFFHHIVVCVCKVKTRRQSIQQAMGESQVTRVEVVIQLLLGNIARKDSILYRNVSSWSYVCGLMALNIRTHHVNEMNGNVLIYMAGTDACCILPLWPSMLKA